MKSSDFSVIEPLESRIAPATLVNSHTVTYTDVDGDLVTVKTDVGNFNLATHFVFANVGVGQQLQILNLDPQFAGAHLSVTAKANPTNGGDGRANVGGINAIAVDLSSVLIDGDLAYMQLGDNTITTPALDSLNVGSLGRYLTTTLPLSIPGFGLNITGKINTMVVRGDVMSPVNLLGGAGAGIGTLTINGSIEGDPMAFTGGFINTSGNIGPVKIGGSLRSNGFPNSGTLFVTGSIGDITIGGSVVSDLGGQNTGGINAFGAISSLKIKGDIRAFKDSNTNNAGGRIAAAQFTNGVTIGGSIRGGAILSSGNIPFIKIGGGIVGGDFPEMGIIRTNNGDIGDISIHGSVIAGTSFGTGAIVNFGSGTIGNVKIGGSLRGFISGIPSSDSAVIRANGTLGNVTIGGSVSGSNANFSGYIFGQNGVGNVKIHGDLLGGSGTNSGSIVSLNGPIGDVSIGGSLSSIVSDFGPNATISGQKIGNVKIGGDLIGGGSGSGSILTTNTFSGTGDIGSVIIKGSVMGSAADSGEIAARGALGLVKIGGNVIGGDGMRSGSVSGNAGIADVLVGGSLMGGNGDYSGSIKSFGNIPNVKIGHDVSGRSHSTAALITAGHFDSVAIGGSMINASGINADHDLVKLTVGGGVISDKFGPGTMITAHGQNTPDFLNGIDLAIGSIKIGGRVERVNIFAGVVGFQNAGAQIGSVTVGGDWIASNLVAGASAGSDGFFGTADDAGGFNGIINRIASVVIGGHGMGSLLSPTPDHFGIVAREVIAVKIEGKSYPLAAGPHNDSASNPLLKVGPTGDFNIVEI